MNHSVSSSLIAIVPAAGIGSRMGASESGNPIPKQYLTIASSGGLKSSVESGGSDAPITIIAATLELLAANTEIKTIIVALHKNDIWFNKLSFSQRAQEKIVPVEGGATRFDSVRHGVAYVKNHIASVTGEENNKNPLILVHDAARPCVSVSKLNQLIRLAQSEHCAVILAAKVSDTVKHQRIDSRGQKRHCTVSRDPLWLAHTPQIAPLDWLYDAFEFALSKAYEVTDESSALEYYASQYGSERMPIIIEDTHSNIKITSRADLDLARAIYANCHELN